MQLRQHNAPGFASSCRQSERLFSPSQRCLLPLQAARKDSSSQSGSTWKDVMQQYRSMVQQPADKPQPQPQPSKPAASKSPKASSPTVKSKPVKTAKPTSSTPGKPAAAKTQSKSGQPQTAKSKPPQKATKPQQSDPPAKRRPAPEPLESTVSSSPAVTGSSSSSSTGYLGGATIISTGRGFGSIAVNSSEQEGPERVRLFAFAVETKRLLKAIQECGWGDRFAFTTDMSRAAAVVSCRMTPGGKHQNLAQGERAAEKAGLPFIVVGRVVSKTTVQRSLAHLLTPSSSSSSSSGSGSADGSHDHSSGDDGDESLRNSSHDSSSRSVGGGGGAGGGNGSSSSSSASDANTVAVA